MAKPKGTKASPSASGIDEITARGLVEAWRVKTVGALPVAELPTGFWACSKYNSTLELEWDRASARLSVRQSPVNFPLDAPPDDAEIARVQARHAKHADRLAGTLTEYTQLRGHAGKWHVVLRMDFVDPSIREAKFVAEVARLGKLATIWRG